jgi:uncharacterized membrane protein YkoI
MTGKHPAKLTLVAAVAGVGLLGGSYAAVGTEGQPAYESSIKVVNQNEGEGGEAAMLASQAKIDTTRATAAALAQVPGHVLKVALDNENGNLVYSVEIKTANNEVKDVKVDAGNATVLAADSGGEDSGVEQEGDQEN